MRSGVPNSGSSTWAEPCLAHRRGHARADGPHGVGPWASVSSASRSIGDGVVGRDGVPGSLLPVRPGDTVRGPVRASPSPKWSGPSSPPAWPPPTVTSRTVRRRPALDLDPGARRRRGSAPSCSSFTASQWPIGSGRSASPLPTLRRRLTFSYAMDLDEVQEAVAIEVHERRSSCAQRVEEAGALRLARGTGRQEGRGAARWGPRARCPGRRPRCPSRRRGPCDRRC